MSRDAVQIGIAVVEHDGRFLVGIRGDDQPLSGAAEFPGGKCQPGEDPRACAVRECREEAALEVIAESLLCTQHQEYDHATVDLHFWHCRPADDGDVQADHHGFRWILAAELSSYPFPEGNAEVVQLLMPGHDR